jgi:hypothetical protein
VERDAIGGPPDSGARGNVNHDVLRQRAGRALAGRLARRHSALTFEAYERVL